MVGNTGFEPVTFRTSSGYSPAELIARGDIVPPPRPFCQDNLVAVIYAAATLGSWCLPFCGVGFFGGSVFFCFFGLNTTSNNHAKPPHPAKTAITPIIIPHTTGAELSLPPFVVVPLSAAIVRFWVAPQWQVRCCTPACPIDAGSMVFHSPKVCPAAGT